ncbi:hypothetical protein Cgig2_021386 [Carnegiea gigantea]|uniref:Uncharacterized protein n=1 Tax=Carnegiea gigantea TaxID=171969 RepID=A0A9Q1KD13_9CARY|nr:hypothetical protein Cgig2_021386 [Carnegiea gigantea]
MKMAGKGAVEEYPTLGEDEIFLEIPYGEVFEKEEGFAHDFEHVKLDSPIPWHEVVGRDANLDFSAGSEYQPESDELEFANNNEAVISNLKRNRRCDKLSSSKGKTVNCDAFQETEDKIDEDEIEGVGDIDTSDDEWEVAKNKLVEFNKQREVEAEVGSAS